MKEATEGVADLMKVFTQEYIKVLINGKLQGAMDEAVETVMPSGLSGGDDDGGDDVVEEKADDEKEQSKPIAAGVQLHGYRLGTGPDYQAHRFYEFACFAIKEQDSVVAKVVKKHSQVTSWQKTFVKQCAEVPKEAVWPKKKMMGKNDEYYRARYTSMDTYFKTITDVDAVSLNDKFLEYWSLQYDPARADRLDIFMSAAEGLCGAKHVNFQRAQRNAERLGFDLDECEMLKVIAVESVGRDCIRKLRAEINKSMNVAPVSVRHRFIAKAEQKLAAVISTGVQSAWDGAKAAFEKLVDTINEVLEKGMDPVRAIFNKALEPIGTVIKEKFSAAEEKLEIDDGLDRKLNISRFPPLKSALESIENGGKAADEIGKLISAINKMEECKLFAGYLMYNLGDPQIGQWIPFLNEIQDNHYRLAVSMTDLAWLISRAATRAFIPLCKYIDFVADSGYDATEFTAGVTKAMRDAGRSLASDYFDIPSQVRRMTWRLPNTVTNRLLKVGQTTICQIADLLGLLTKNWKPTNKDDVKSTFVKAIAEPLDNFIEDRTKLWVTVIRRGTEAVIANQFMTTVEKLINEIAEPLNELTKGLPDPLGENLKPGDIVSYLLNKMCENAIVKVVAKIALNTETTLYDIAKFAEPANSDVVWRVRYRPYVRPDNYDPASPAEEKDDDDDDKADANKENDAAKENTTDDAAKTDDAAAIEVKRQITNDNTPDSDDEDAPASPKQE